MVGRGTTALRRGSEKSSNRVILDRALPAAGRASRIWGRTSGIGVSSAVIKSCTYRPVVWRLGLSQRTVVNLCDLLGPPSTPGLPLELFQVDKVLEELGNSVMGPPTGCLSAQAEARDGCDLVQFFPYRRVKGHVFPESVDGSHGRHSDAAVVFPAMVRVVDGGGGGRVLLLAIEIRVSEVMARVTGRLDCDVERQWAGPLPLAEEFKGCREADPEGVAHGIPLSLIHLLLASAAVVFRQPDGQLDVLHQSEFTSPVDHVEEVETLKPLAREGERAEGGGLDDRLPLGVNGGVRSQGDSVLLDGFHQLLQDHDPELGGEQKPRWSGGLHLKFVYRELIHKRLMATGWMGARLATTKFDVDEAGNDDEVDGGEVGDNDEVRRRRGWRRRGRGRQG